MSELRIVGELMAVAARTAPKTAGKDYVVTRVLEGDDVRTFGQQMIDYGAEHGLRNFDRDGRNVCASDTMVLIGLKDAQTSGLDCGACGVEFCSALEPNSLDGQFRGPQCAFRLVDVGIAIGSAAKMAGLLNADNRIMYRAGVVARQMGWIDADFVLGIPLSATGKSIYFDR